MLQLRRTKEPPPGLLKRTYQNELRAIGRHCDDNSFRTICICEVTDGFILRAFHDIADPASVDAIEIPDSDLQNLILKNFTAQSAPSSKSRSPLCPTGYEDFFRALGYELEENQAKAVTVQEMDDAFAITYHQLQPTSEEGYIWEPKSLLLKGGHVQELLDEAFRRRGNGP
jgi:hypothetical protein